jgi:predicted nucleic acid-binding protein
MTIISNTTVLSNFASIGVLDLLRQLYQTLTIPVEVYEEIEVPLPKCWSSLTFTPTYAGFQA